MFPKEASSMSITLTDLIALYGAVVATLVAVDQFRKSRSHVVVDVLRVWISDSDGCFSDEELSVRAANTGTRTVCFGSLPSLCHGKTAMVVPFPHLDSDSFPLELQPGGSCKVFIDPVRIAGDLKKSGVHGTVNLRGRFVDETGRVYRSNRFRFDVDSPLLPDKQPQEDPTPERPSGEG
jgi:hypothetical protein